MNKIDKYGYIIFDDTENSDTSNNQYKRAGKMASTGMFWLLTILIAMGIQAFIQGIWGADIVGSVFGYSYGSGIEYWGRNLAIKVGSWGFVICGFIGILVYNILLCDSGKIFGYHWYHYVLSILMSLTCSAAWIPLIFIISIAIVLFAIVCMLFVVAFAIIIVCRILSEI